MAILFTLIFWGAMFGWGFKVAAKKTSNPVAQVFLGIFLGIMFMAGTVAVLCGVAFAGCLLIMSTNR